MSLEKCLDITVLVLLVAPLILLIAIAVDMIRTSQTKGTLARLHSQFWLWLHDYCRHGVKYHTGMFKWTECPQCISENHAEHRRKDSKAQGIAKSLGRAR